MSLSDNLDTQTGIEAPDVRTAKSAGQEQSMQHGSPSLALRLLNTLFVIPVMFLVTVLCGTISLLSSLWDRAGRQQHAMARIWARMLLRISLSPVSLSGAENLPPGRLAVYASNHTSYMDTPVLFAKLPFQFRILAKASLWPIPFIGWHLNRSGQIPVDQTSPRSLVASLGRGVAALKCGLPLVVFPDGRRTTDGHMQQFRPGAAWMAIRAQVPLVPIALVGTYELLPMHVYHVTPRPLHVIVGEPISTSGMTTRDADVLTQQLYDAIAAMYYRHSPDRSPRESSQKHSS